MIEALGLAPDQAPRHLSETIVPILDAAQQGWGSSATRHLPVVWGPLSFVGTGVVDAYTGVDEELNDSTKQSVCHSLRVDSPSIGLYDAWLELRAPGGNLVVLNKTSPTTAGVSMLPGHRPLFVPPGHRLQVRIVTALISGVTGQVVFTEMPAGFAGGTP
jgi:hypothetical protein